MPSRRKRGCCAAPPIEGKLLPLLSDRPSVEAQEQKAIRVHLIAPLSARSAPRLTSPWRQRRCSDYVSP
jgi:hypothetical protein